MERTRIRHRPLRKTTDLMRSIFEVEGKSAAGVRIGVIEGKG